jgi:glycosyltransferase involved in cell wall biosynthesis
MSGHVPGAMAGGPVMRHESRTWKLMAASSALRRQQWSEASSRAAGISKPRVCFVGLGNLPVLAREYNRHAIGGEQVQHTLLAKALARRGYEVSMVTADYGQSEGATWDGVKTHKAFALDTGVPLVRFIHPRWSGAWSAFKRADADLYYTSCAGALVGQLALFCRRHGRKLVFRVASDTDCEPDRLLVKYWRDRKLYEYGLRRADAILAQSRYQQGLLERNYGLRSSLAGMLVDSGDAALPFSRRDLTVLWVNNLRQLKRPELLLDAAERLPELSFHMVGGPAAGAMRFFEDIEAQARLRSNVTFHGQVPYHDVNSLYERARVFVNTSDIEGFPNSYLQAWARGTPVVAFFDPDGLIEREGLGMTVDTPQQLPGAIRALASDPAAWAAASARCRAFIGRHYGEEKVLSHYRALVDSLCEAVRR